MIQSIAFGATLTIGTLFFHDFQPAGRMSIWAEACIRFFAATVVNFLVLQLFDRKKVK